MAKMANSTAETPILEEKENKNAALGEKAVKQLLAQGKQRGYITYEELNETLPEDKLSSEQIEDIMSMISDMGINIVEDKEAEQEDKTKQTAKDNEEEETVEAREAGKTDDPVRLYLREMGSVELLSREGEIEIAKRIESGREMLIGAICESPLTIRAIVTWRDALNKDQMLLRDIIDIESTYTNGPSDEEDAENYDEEGSLIVTPSSASKEPKGEVEYGESDGEGDEDDEAAGLSVSAMEDSLRPKVVDTFNQIAKTYTQLRKLQEQRLKTLHEGAKASSSTEKKYEDIRKKLVELLEGIHLNSSRIEQLVEQLYTLNRKLVGLEGRLLRLAEAAGVKREVLLENYYGSELDTEWFYKLETLSSKGWKTFLDKHKEEALTIRKIIAEVAD